MIIRVVHTIIMMIMKHSVLPLVVRSLTPPPLLPGHPMVPTSPILFYLSDIPLPLAAAWGHHPSTLSLTLGSQGHAVGPASPAALSEVVSGMTLEHEAAGDSVRPCPSVDFYSHRIVIILEQRVSTTRLLGYPSWSC